MQGLRFHIANEQLLLLASFYVSGYDIIRLVNWVRGDVKGLNWIEIIRSPWPVLSLSEALLRVISNRVAKRTIVVKTGDKPWFDDWCLAHRAKQRAYRVWSRSRTQADWEEYKVARRHSSFSSCP